MELNEALKVVLELAEQHMHTYIRKLTKKVPKQCR